MTWKIVLSKKVISEWEFHSDSIGIPLGISMEFPWNFPGIPLGIHRNFRFLQFLRIPSGKSEFCGIPRNFNGKQLAGASAISHFHSMEIPTFFRGIPMELVGIREAPGTIPMGIHNISFQIPWNSNGNYISVKFQIDSVGIPYGFHQISEEMKEMQLLL